MMRTVYNGAAAGEFMDLIPGSPAAFEITLSDPANFSLRNCAEGR
jgi:hypothetical protein